MSEDAAPWHAIPLRDVFESLGTGPDGLSGSDAETRLARVGPNTIPTLPRPGPVTRLLKQFHNVLIYILLVAAAVTAVLDHWIDAGVILGVVVINAVIGFIQEGQAERALDAISDMLAPEAIVVRGGVRSHVPAVDLVPGDIVLLKSGDKVPADLRLFDAHSLLIQEAALTGESLAVGKAPDPVAADADLGDRQCMAYSGTLVAQGTGQGVVVVTGAATEVGRIGTMLAGIADISTPLLRQIAVFGRWLSVAILVLAAATFFYGVIVQDYSSSEMFLAAVGLSVAAIPEGLPAIMTVALAIGVTRMARRNAIVRRLPAVETLGSVSVICADKTGTLTRNELTAQALVTARHTYRVTGTGYGGEGGILLDGAAVRPDEHPDLVRAARGAALCNDAQLAPSNGQVRLVGSPTDGALLSFALKAGCASADLSAALPRVGLIPFDSEHKFMATAHRDAAGGYLFVKGAPERVLEMCAEQYEDGEARPIDHARWHSRTEELAASGQRVIAIAGRPTDRAMSDLGFGDVEQGLILVGLVGLIDPPRQSAITAVAECREAGIRVKMITGDHAETARAVSRALGIGNSHGVVTGRQLDAADDDAFAALAIEADVFARTTPAHKLRLIEALQKRGDVIAMTGDGVNDAPALQRADIGVAMGRKGTEAAKEAAEMVIVDDNFASIAHAVEEGRTIYDNLKKSILFILPTSFGEALTIIVAVMLGHTLPITPVQILWINMATTVTLALALGFEPVEPGVMRRPPRSPGEPILSPLLVWRTALVSVLLVAGAFGLFVLERAAGGSVEAARTIATNAIVAGEAVYLVNCRRIHDPAWTLSGLFGSRPVLLSIGLVAVAQMLFTYLPAMQFLFRTAPLALPDWGKISAFAVGVFVLVELEKALIGRLIGPRTA